MRYFVYNDDTGVIVSIGGGQPAPVDRSAYDTPAAYQTALAAAKSSFLSAIAPEDHTAREGSADPYTQKWDTVNNKLIAYTPPDDTDYAAINRGRRDSRLVESDWTQLPDSPLTSTKKTEWATYRQELRDLPEDLDDFDTAFVSGSDWPTKPS